MIFGATTNARDKTLPKDDTRQGDKLSSALKELSENPDLLARARNRFENPLPSHQSLTTTRSQSPIPRSEEQTRLEERKWQLISDWRACSTRRQYDAQVGELREQLFEPVGDRGTGTDYSTWYCARDTGAIVSEGGALSRAHESVKKDWVEQGIWNESWKETPHGWWMHQRPPVIENESSGIEANAPPFPFLPAEGKKQNLGPGQERKYEASRPIFQFNYQVSKERERILEEMNSAAPSTEPAETPCDINTTAYTRVKDKWTKRGIWDTRWGILPGMSWKCEQPLEEFLREQMGHDYDRLETLQLEHERLRRGEAVITSPPPAPLTLGPNHEGTGKTNTPPKETIPVIDDVSLPNGGYNHSPSLPHSPRDQAMEAQEASGAATMPRQRRQRRCKGRFSDNDGHGPRIAPTARTPSIAPSNLPLPQKECPMPTRRSKRLQERKRGADGDLPDGGSQPKRKRAKADLKPGNLANFQGPPKRKKVNKG